jgi:GNAT superfamily N-acetyltransferase
MKLVDDDYWRWYGEPKIETDVSHLDTKRWGVKTSRINPQTKYELSKDYKGFVIARIDTRRLDLVQYAERIGYRLCDTLVYWKGKNVKGDSLPTGYWSRPLKQGEKCLEPLARESFTGYLGHYHSDPQLGEKATEAYVEWASTFQDGIVIEHEVYEYPVVTRDPVAFGCFSTPCELTLGGVSSSHRGKGLYRQLVLSCMAWGLRNGIPEIEISTQITNLSVQKVWASLGLKPFKSVYTFHLWP